jgi:hypothetical protein
VGQVIVDCNITSILFFLEEGLVFRAEEMFSAELSIMPEKKDDWICLLSDKLLIIRHIIFHLFGHGLQIRGVRKKYDQVNINNSGSYVCF